MAEPICTKPSPLLVYFFSFTSLGNPLESTSKYALLSILDRRVQRQRDSDETPASIGTVL